MIGTKENTKQYQGIFRLCLLVKSTGPPLRVPLDEKHFKMLETFPAENIASLKAITTSEQPGSLVGER